MHLRHPREYARRIVERFSAHGATPSCRAGGATSASVPETSGAMPARGSPAYGLGEALPAAGRHVLMLARLIIDDV